MMESATLKIDAEQRHLTPQYLKIQVSRAASERQEAVRKSRVAKAQNEAVDRLRSEVDSARGSMLQEAESLRSGAAAMLGQIALCQTKADGLLHLLRRRGDLAKLKLPADRQAGPSDPERALNQSLQVAQEALSELDAALRELAKLEAGAARLRLLLATVSVVIITGLLGHFWGVAQALLLFPILLAATISLFRLDHGVMFVDRVMSYAVQKRARASAKPWYSVPRNYFGGLTVIRNATESISNPYVQSGTRAAATMYLTGSAAGVAAAAAYALMFAIVAFVVVGIFLVVLWVIVKMLEDA